MDLSTVIGLVLGVGAIVGSLLIEGGELSSLINISALILVIGGTLGATTISFPLPKMIGLMPVFKNVLFSKAESPAEAVKQLVEFTRKARRDGILSLEADAQKLENRVLRTGLQLIVDGNPEEIVRGVLESEVLAMQERHRDGAKLFDTMGGFAPTMGVIGTVMGLVHMLSNLNDPGKMGPMIAAAFIATLYGVITANLFFLPFGAKLKARSAEEVANYEMIIEGLLALQAGDNPRIVETKMVAFCPPKVRASMLSEAAA